MRLIKYFLTLVLMIAVDCAHAQYLPNSNQTYQFSSVHNPAFTGIEKYGDLKLGYRYQWTGFGRNAPKFINLLYSCRLSNPQDVRRNAFRTSSYRRVPGRKQLIHAAGVSLFNESIGPISRLGGGINYSVHYPLVNNKMWIATGVSANVDHTRVNIDEIYLGNNPDPDPFYDRLLANGANRTDLNIRAGVLFYTPIFYVGVCYLPILNQSLATSEGNFSETFYNGTFQSGISIKVNEQFQVRPSIAGIWQTNSETLIDYGVKAYYKERIWLGATYRDTDSGVGLVGFNISNLIAATYSYEVPMNSLRQFSDGSHELVLSLKLKNTRGHNAFIW
jgi:type IX secretion system PorP/SprF family membrane protein